MTKFLLSIVIPCFNEKDHIRAVIERIRSAVQIPYEIIIVDDGSTDGTTELLKKEIEPLVDKIIYKSRNEGKGAALQIGFKEARGDIVLIQDADLEYNPQEYPLLIKPIQEDRADVVFGSRFIGAQEHRVLYFWHMVGNKFLTFLSNIFTNINLTDMECGYKVFRKEICQKLQLKERGFGCEPEMTAKVAKLKCRIYEVGVSYSGRTYQQGKKIQWIDGVWAIWCIVRHNIFER